VVEGLVAGCVHQQREVVVELELVVVVERTVVKVAEMQPGKEKAHAQVKVKVKAKGMVIVVKVRETDVVKVKVKQGLARGTVMELGLVGEVVVSQWWAQVVGSVVLFAAVGMQGGREPLQGEAWVVVGRVVVEVGWALGWVVMGLGWVINSVLVVAGGAGDVAMVEVVYVGEREVARALRSCQVAEEVEGSSQQVKVEVVAGQVVGRGQE
jgi:hypothetical protein